MKDQQIHPSDIGLFKTVKDAMEFVAKTYELPLKSITPMANPEYSSAPLGDCSSDGNIRLTLRGMENGRWAEESRAEQDVWRTAAHELSHLRFMDHESHFWEFMMELETALNNRRVDYQQKLIDKLVKLQAQKNSERELGNIEAAEAFAGMINKMLIEFELSQSDIDYARSADKDPVIEIFCDLSKYRPKSHWRKEYQAENKNKRIAWQEELARVVANGHLCTFLIQQNSNRITFVGTKSHAIVAEYCYGTLVHAAQRMSVDANYAYNKFTSPDLKRPGYRESWLAAFVARIAERLREIKLASVKNVSPDLNVQNNALMRLNQSLVKTQKYIDDKFSGKNVKYASELQRGRMRNRNGVEDGKAAADRMNIGRRGLEPTKVKGYLG